MENQEQKFSISLESIVNEFHFDIISLPEDANKIAVSTKEIDRPGLALTGFFEIFDSDRIQLIGNAEHKYLGGLSGDERHRHIMNFVEKKPVAVIMTAGHTASPDFIEACRAYGVPLLASDEPTTDLMAEMFAYLAVSLAPRVTIHAVLVEVYGEGVLLIGDSGIGKSETAIELVKRGHRLVADDAVEIKKVSAKSLVGSAPELLEHYVELRGIGVVDVSRIFGMGAVKATEKIELVIKLENWVDGKMYDRLGIEEEKEDILGITLPAITVPVKPGRNLAVIIEIAAMNHRQKKMGYNAAEEFTKRIIEHNTEAAL
ncbi:MAG: HPr(Ser) kinase/phosphatase [Clostridia bacterium]|nr:HPr(Ser) kinase/phosphatase [Clostridia bacterium]MBP5174065.1 HPr(Ser) kinase/phosphatase [Clostridia bacterium]